MSKETVDIIYDTLKDFREECRTEFSEIKENARIHSTEMHEHKEDTAENVKEINGRLTELEKPKVAREVLKSWAGWVLAVGGAVAFIVDRIT